MEVLGIGSVRVCPSVLHVVPNYKFVLQVVSFGDHFCSSQMHPSASKQQPKEPRRTFLAPVKVVPGSDTVRFWHS